MDRLVWRRKLEMAVRVSDSCRAHPSADANHASVLGRLNEADRADGGRRCSSRWEAVLSRQSSVTRRGYPRRRVHTAVCCGTW